MPINFDRYKLALFAKLPIYLNGIPFYSPTIKEIAEITEETYNTYLSVSTITKNRIEMQDEIKISDFDFLICWLFYEESEENNAESNESEKNIELFLQALNFWTKCNFTIVRVDNDIYICKLDNGKKYSIEHSINKDNYYDFISIIQFINCLKAEDKDELKKESKAVLALEEEIRKAREKVNKKLKKSKSNKNLDLFDLVSVLASNGNNVSPLNVTDLNIFTFQDQFQRMQIVENYDIQIRSLLSAGAEIKNIEHYIKKL